MNLILVLSLGLRLSAAPIGAQTAAPEVKSFPRVDAEIMKYDGAISKMEKDFNSSPEDPNNREWVESKLAHMYDLDQYMRQETEAPVANQYSDDEREYFLNEFASRYQGIDKANAKDLKEILGRYGWPKISEWGKEYDQIAWIIVQHADGDLSFQKEALAMLEPLVPKQETNPQNYAFLYDRIAAQEERLQRYGTQGSCVAPGQWQPAPTEDPDHLDERRKFMGLESLAAYKKRFATLCH